MTSRSITPFHSQCCVPGALPDARIEANYSNLLKIERVGVSLLRMRGESALPRNAPVRFPSDSGRIQYRQPQTVVKGKMPPGKGARKWVWTLV